MGIVIDINGTAINAGHVTRVTKVDNWSSNQYSFKVELINGRCYEYYFNDVETATNKRTDLINAMRGV